MSNLTEKLLKASLAIRYLIPDFSLHDSSPDLLFFPRLIRFIYPPHSMVKLPTKLPSSSYDTLDQEWEVAHQNFIRIEELETKLFQLRNELPILDISNHRVLSSKIRLMERHKKKWLAIMYGLTHLIEKRA